MPDEYDRWGPFWSTNHFQGLQRIRSGNYLAISGNGKTHSHLFIIEMRSRARNGPFGSNLTSRDENLPRFDKVVKKVAIHSEMTHAGGFQSVGDYIAVGIEHDGLSRVILYDVSEPTSPKSVNEVDRTSLALVAGQKPSAGAVGILKQSDGKYLLVVGRADSLVLDFYRSRGDSLDVTGFDFIGSWKKAELKSDNGMDDNFGKYQSLNLIQQCDGEVFLLGLHRRGGTGGVTGGGSDFADLFRVKFKRNGQPEITKTANKHLTCDGCNMDAGSGVFVDVSGAMYIYGVEHWYDDSQVRFNEFS